MGLLNARNLRKAKQLLDQNRHKVGDVVGKATTKLDEVSKGKTSNISKKAEEAARKYSAGGATNHGATNHGATNHGATNHGAHVDAVSDGQNMAQGATGSVSKDETRLRQSEARAAAVTALANVANAASGFLNKAAQMQAQAAGATDSASAGASDGASEAGVSDGASDGATPPVTGAADVPPPVDGPPPLPDQ